MPKNEDRPGIMLYFDDFKPILKKLDDENVGKLLRAAFAYARDEDLPEMDTSLEIIFGILAARIDKDAERYNDRVNSNRYAAYCRDAKKNGDEPMSRDEFYQMISDDIK